MAGILVYATFILFFACLIANIFLWIKTWEDKKYSLRRLFISVIETKSGRNTFLGITGILKWIVIFLYIVTIFSSSYDFYFEIVVFIFYSLLFLLLTKKIIDKSLSVPSFSIVTVVVTFLTLLIVCLLFAFPPVDQFLWILILDKLAPVLVAIFVSVISIFFDFSTDVTINRAVAKIESRPDLLSIAVVGSYGRGSTKEFITKVLSTKFNVLETKKSFSDAVGISKTIISGLTQKKKIFIVEMDDYSVQDISDMASIVKPKICVVCGINEQKLSEFGSINKIIDAKYEVIKSLARDGISIFNFNNQNSKQLFSKTKVKKFSYYVGEKEKADIYVTHFSQTRFSLSFDVVVFGKKYKLSGINLLGRQNVENLLPAIFIGIYMGIDFSKIKKALSEIKPLSGTMDVKKAINGPVLIDDTYNANINSVYRALSYIKVFRGKKIMVFEPLTELGKYAKPDHIKIGAAIGKVCDKLFLTNKNYTKEIIQGIKSVNSKCQVEIATSGKIVQFVVSCKKSDVVLFEGKEANTPFSYIKKESVY